MDFHFTDHPDAVYLVRVAARSRRGSSVRRGARRWWSRSRQDGRRQRSDWTSSAPNGYSPTTAFLIHRESSDAGRRVRS